jgi:serine/threonine protein kinase
MSASSRRIGQYELQEQLGRGSVAEVWKAFDVQLHRHVAIKLLHANLQEDTNFVVRFEREARFIASLHHPNIVQVHDFQIASEDVDGTTAYMVMEYIEGQTLARYIDGTSKLGNIPHPTVIVQFFTSICLAVHYAHQKGMIHRDLKPANILLDTHNTTNNPIGEPILTDFGVARLLGVAAGTFTNTQLGTPLYISPEQAQGYAGNEHSDIYSLGIILYEIATGKPPFQGDDPVAIMTQHLNTAPSSPRLVNPNIPPALEMVILRCLAKDPGARFPDALSLAAAVAEGLNIPIPERLGKSTSPIDVMGAPTYLTPSPSNMPLPSPNSPSTYPLAQNNPLMTPSLSGVISGQIMASAPPSVPTMQPPVTTRPPVLTPKVTRQRKGLILGLLALVVLLLSGSLGVYFLFSPSASAGQIVGRAFFVSSGQLNDGAQGIADTLQIDLQNIQAPPAGKSYSLWLLTDKDTTPKPDLLVPAPIHPPILLTKALSVQNNTVRYTYPGDAQHNNLLSEASRLLITLEDAGRTPTNPSPEPANWKYYAELPQAPIPTDPKGLRGLDHIRHLYYNENHVKVLGLYGGLDIWAFKNTEKILEWSVSARDDFNGSTSNYELMHNLFISILDYLDGIPNVYVDLPPETPILADATVARVSLLTVDVTRQGVADFLDTDPPGDLDHIALHLNQLVKAPDVSVESRQHAQNILVALDNAKKWLQQVRKDAKELFYMTPEQLAQSSAQGTLEDLATQATYAYVGQLDPATNKVLPGILQAHYDIQKLATFDITTHVPTSL